MGLIPYSFAPHILFFVLYTLDLLPWYLLFAMVLAERSNKIMSHINDSSNQVKPLAESLLEPYLASQFCRH